MGRVRHRYVRQAAFLAGLAWGITALCSGCGSSFESPPESVITTDKYRLSRFLFPSSATASLRIIPAAGEQPFTFSWSAVDPAGEQVDGLLDSVTGSDVRFTAGAIDGPYAVSCRVKDAGGASHIARIVLHVGGTVGVRNPKERLGVLAGGGTRGQTTVRINPNDRMPMSSALWTCIGPDGKVDNDRLDTTDTMSPVFTSADRTGPYVLTAELRDADGVVALESVIVVVAQNPGLDVAAGRASVLPGGRADGMVTLVATPISGQDSHDYDWQVIGPGGEPRTELLWGTDVRSPIFESDTETGTFLVRCAATDTAGQVFIGSTTVTVSPQISVKVVADRLALPRNTSTAVQANLSVELRGGREPIDIGWRVSGPDGGDYAHLLSGDDEPEVVFTPGEQTGLYVIRCTATDADNVFSTDALVLTVGEQLGLDVRTNRASLSVAGPSPTHAARLDALAYGGLPPYTYRWSVINPSGEQKPLALSGANQRNPVVVSSSRVGTYAVLCKVTDADGSVAVDSAQITVGQPLNVEVAVDQRVLADGGGVGGQAYALTSILGGSAPYSYQWHVTDPNGVPDGSRLSDTSVASPVFTSGLTTGTYLLTLTAADELDSVFVDSVELVVTGEDGGTSAQSFSIDVSIDRQIVAPSGGAASLAAMAVGGVPPIDYAWMVTDPTGEADNALLDSTVDAEVNFTSAATQGTYRIRCTATDAVGNTFTDSVQLTVSDDFNLDVRAAVTHVAPGGSIELLADRSGGKADFTFAWSGINDGGVSAGSFAEGSTGVGAASQTAGDDVTNVWTAPSDSDVLGAYRIAVTASDTDGREFTDSVIVNVTNAFLVEVTATATHVEPGGAVNLTANRTGGKPHFTYTWSSVNTAGTSAGTFTTGSTGTGAAEQVTVDDATNTWTAPPAGVGTLGTYRITVVASDSDGNSFTDAVEVVVTEPFSINLATGSPVIAPGGSTTIVADRSGGEPSFTYLWTATDSSLAAAGAFTAGPTGTGAARQTGMPDDATNTWIAPAIPVGTTETFTITCIAADMFGSTFTDSAQFVVGTSEVLTIDLTANQVFLAPGEAVDLSVDQRGGTASFDYTWTALDESGVTAGTLAAVSQTAVPGDTTNTWTAPAAGTGTLGTYRIEVVATDATGDSFADSVHVVVHSPLSLVLTANNTFIYPGASVSLVADQTGGEAAYRYTWSAKDSTGTNVGTFTSGAGAAGTATQNGVAADSTNNWSTAPEGTYTITCTVTDNVGQVFTDSVSVVATTEDAFSLDVTADKHFVAPGELVNLVGDQTGGQASFSYAWSAINETGSASGTLGSASQGNIANDTTNTWTAPTGADVEGTYRIACTVTDLLSRSFTDTIAVEVSSLALQNIFLSPAAAAVNNVLALTNLTPSAGGADPGQQINAGLTNPAYPRNVVITIVDVNNSITGGTARIAGLDARGITQSEVITIAASGGGTSTNTGAAPFATVTRIDLFTFAGANAFIDQVQLGTGDKFGLTGRLTAASDVLYVNEGGTVATAGYTVASAAGQQGITFANAPDGARNYIVVFRAR